MLKALKLGSATTVNLVAFSRNVEVVASASNAELASRIVSIWGVGNIQNFSKPVTAEIDQLSRGYHIGPSEEVNAMAFSPCGTMLACACGGEFSEVHCTYVWSIDSGQAVVEPLRAHTSAVLAVAWNSQCDVLASGSEDTSVRLWSIPSGQEVTPPLRSHSGPVRAVAFNSSGTLVCSGSDDFTLKLWSAADGLLQGTWFGHSGPVFALAWRADDRVIASGSHDKTVRLWSVETGQQVMPPLTGHTDSVSTLAWSPTSNCLASGSDDRKVWMWSGNTGQAVLGPMSLHVSQISIPMPVLTGHLEKIVCVSFDPGGNKLVSADAAGVIIVWDALRTEDRLAVAMAAHPRLGEYSPLSLIQPETLSFIADLVSNEAPPPPHEEEEGSPWLNSPYSVANRSTLTFW